MKEPEPFIVNKYGAVESTTILKLIDRVEKLEELITDYRKTLIIIYGELFGCDIDNPDDFEFERPIFGKGYIIMPEGIISSAFKESIKDRDSVIRKLRLLTKADDYEFVTETKLVKKKGKE